MSSLVMEESIACIRGTSLFNKIDCMTPSDIAPPSWEKNKVMAVVTGVSQDSETV